MLYTIYNRITNFSEPLLRQLIKHRLGKGKEHSTRWSERTGRPSADRPDGQLLWIHGASVGESLSAIPLISAMKDAMPSLNILVTTGTVTSANLMDDRLPENVIHQFIPIDHPTWVKRFLHHWQPDTVVWLESELWPNMLHEIKNRNIPAALVNARMSEKSFKWWSKAKTFAKDILDCFNICLAQTEIDATHFTSLGHTNVRNVGNLKYASGILPYDEGELSLLKQAIGDRPFWLFASTHAGEEEKAITAHKDLKKEKENVLSIIALRHPTRAHEISQMFYGANFKVALRSKDKVPAPDTDIFIVDTLGEMGLFFKLADIVAMGGSYVPHGGHNPIEPASMGCAVISGEHMFNFIEICEQMESQECLIRTLTMFQLKNNIIELLNTPEKLYDIQEKCIKFTTEKRAVLPKIVDRIVPLLEQKEST